MRIGLTVHVEPGYGDKVAGLIRDAQSAELAGFSSIWIAQIPSDFEALIGVALMGQATKRIEVGPAVAIIQSRHPITMAQQALSIQSVCAGRLTLGIGVSHGWIVTDMLGLPYETPAAQVRSYLEVLSGALGGPGTVNVKNDVYRVNHQLDITDITPTPILLAALGPLMLRLAGERTAGTILSLADERAVSEHIVPQITRAASEAGRPEPRVVAGVPVILCRKDEVDKARAVVNGVYEYAAQLPNYQRLMEHGDARTPGDLAAVGDESTVQARLRRFRDAGVTDFDAWVVPFGSDRDAQMASRRRTEQFLASLVPQI